MKNAAVGWMILACIDITSSTVLYTWSVMTAKGVIYYYIPSGIAMMRVVVGVWWFVEA